MVERNERRLLAAQGYCELGMFEDALGELAALPEEVRLLAPSVELRIVILMQAKRWKPALNACNELCKLDPERPTGFIHAAYCLHELGRTADARDLLLDGPEALRAEPAFHYNLACYECRLGQLDAARAHLEKSFTLNKHFREFAKTDPDLAPLRG